MKILHISSEKGWRGGERQVILLMGALARRKIHCSLLCKKNSDLHLFCVKNEIPHYTAPFRNSFDVETAIFIKDISEKENYDILHLHTPKAHTLSVIAGLLGLKASMVLTKRTAFKIKKNYFTLFKYNYPAIKKIIAISEKIASQLRNVITETTKIEKIYSSIDLTSYSHQSSNILREELQIPSEAKLIGIVAALSPEKDHSTFIKMAKVLHKTRPDLHFVIIGKGALEIQLKEDVAEKKMQEAIHFAGYRKDIYRLLPELDVLLLTSLEEGLGSVILDAFASKTPVVATRTGGIPEIVLHEKTGLLAPIKDPESLAVLVERVLDDAKLSTRLIDNAFLFVQDFSKEKTAERTIALYKEILER